MSSFAPRSVLLGAFRRIHTARVAQSLGVVVIAGVSYAGELNLGHVTPQQDAGTGDVHLAQTGNVHIAKALLKTPPPRDSVLQIEGVDYTVESCGSSPNAAAWHIKFYRLAPK